MKISPIMVAMYGARRFWRDEGHAIVLIKFKDGIFTYLDPWFSGNSKWHIKTIDISNFYKYYAGFSCQLLPKIDSLEQK